MFENVLGHEKEKQLLKNNISNNNISHAYLFTGKKGIGKFTLAKEFAKVILKVDNLDSCPDYKCIRKKQDKKDIVIEQIRKEVIEDIYVIPATGEYKVYIIDDAESLNVASQNSLLKTLEEPPVYVVLILISSNESSFLPTILSRVNKIAFESLKNEIINKYIFEKYNVSLDDNIIRYLDGSIGFASNIVENNLLSKFKNVEELYNLIAKKSIIDSLKYSQNIQFTEGNLLDYLEYMLYFNNKYRSIRYVERAIKRLKNNGNYDIVIDSMILKIIESI